jgi:inorganic pyrophosphatase
MLFRHLAAVMAFGVGIAGAQDQTFHPDTLPAMATAQLTRSLQASARHATHVWRDTAPRNADGTVSAYIEISRGDRRKWELDMGANARTIDRVMPGNMGGYPVNYGFVPQTVSFDGDPFDALVLGPPIEGGETVRGIIVGLMYMEDEKGVDSKVVLSRTGPGDRPLHALTTGEQHRIADYFRRYKEHQVGAFSKVPGWGSAGEGAALVTRTHLFFLRCRDRSGQPCKVGQ